MAENYVLLERIELNADASSVSFTNIPQTGYTDLKVLISGRTNRSDQTVDLFTMRFNNDSSALYSSRLIYSYGSGTATGSDSGQTTLTSVALANGNTATSSVFGSTEVHIPNYTGSTYKSVSGDGVAENNATAGWSWIAAGLYSSTNAINQITFYPANSTLILKYSTFSLYGLAATGTTPSIAPKASGGNIYSDGTYWYHAFLSTATFTPATNLTCDALVVAGGGGGGGNSGGGGGAGGFRTASSLSLTASTAYTVTIGSGGTGGPAEASSGTAGTDSTLSTITSTGGGLGAGYVTAGGNGGSGGGGNEVSSTAGGSGNTPSTSPSQGNNGAAGATNRGGGGGGAGAAGSGKDGGNGNYNAISGGSTTGLGVLSSGNYYFAGGGGAGNYGASGVGGLGGGGTGAAQTGAAQTAGTTNTGGGGGGGGDSARYGKNGGSGIVIIRYAMA